MQRLFSRKKENAVPKTFQLKIILYNLLIVICIAGAISFYNYASYRDTAYHSAASAAEDRISGLSANLTVAYNEMVNIVLNCAERSSLFRYITMSSRNAAAFAENPSNRLMGVYSADVLKDYCAISGYNNYIYKLIVNADGLILQAGTAYGHSSDSKMIMSQPWFQNLLYKENSQYALSLVDNPFSKANNMYTPQLVPIVRPLKYRAGLPRENAWVFLAIRPSLFQDALGQQPSNKIFYITTQNGDILASQNSGRYNSDELIRTLLDSPETSGTLSIRLEGDPCTVIYQKQDVSRLLIMEILPEKDIIMDHSVIIKTIMITFLFCIFIGLILSVAISRLLGAPINRMVSRIQLISGGNFEQDRAIETADELGLIGRQINQMTDHISTLMDTRVQSEKEKKDLEIKMLQAQINPHFLYNTLDSIKWIATIQKNSGIVQVVTALSSLLKNMAKGFNEKVTLRQELDFLQNYIVIEKIRYVELFDVETIMESEALYNARIIKLTLQPIVENAIFCGIEPSGRSGIIKIHAYTRNGILYVEVTDNGIGITQENIQKLLTDTSRVSGSNMSGIGLPNVDRRLKLVYGEDYGLTIESELDQYTRITISLPLET